MQERRLAAGGPINSKSGVRTGGVQAGRHLSRQGGWQRLGAVALAAVPILATGLAAVLAAPGTAAAATTTSTTSTTLPLVPTSVPGAPTTTTSLNPTVPVLTTAPATPTTTAPVLHGPGVKKGYWLVRSNGAVAHYGIHYFGDLSKSTLSKPIIGAAATPDGGGYWLAASNGGVYVFGDAVFRGSAGSLHLHKPIVGMAATPDGGGYWLVASDGGIFAYGDARFYGSTGAMHLNKPIVGIAATPDGGGYWLVASDGGIFAYGDARFYGSTGAMHLNKPIVGIAATPDGGGYWLVASDGGIFAYGDARYYGSTGKVRLSQPISGIAPTADGRGYWLADRSGAVYAYGDAPTIVAPKGSNDPAGVVAIVATHYSVSATTLPAVTTTTTAPPTTTTTPTTTTAPPATTTTTTTVVVGPGYPYVPRSTGYDVSWPQCYPKGSARTRALPSSPTFAVVGVNDGHIDDFNPCFVAEAQWAGSNLSVYVILQPVPKTTSSLETTGPDAGCAPTSAVCKAYDWGYNYAQADVAFVRSKGYLPHLWWLDIEVGEGWTTTGAAQPANAAVVQGAMDAVRAAGDQPGIYGTWFQWGLITGSYVPPGGEPIWVAGAQTLSGGNYSAQSYCQRALQPGDPTTLTSSSLGFAGGAPWLVQYGYGPGSNPVDPDYACG